MYYLTLTLILYSLNLNVWIRHNEKYVLYLRINFVKHLACNT